MAVFKCKMCGADLNESAENNIYECEYCGTRQTVTMESGLEAVIFSLLSRAKSYLMKGNFEKANEYFDKVLDFAPENEEALLGKLLVEFNAKSIEDLIKNTVIFIFSENYKLLMENCSLEMKQKLDTALQKVKDNFEIALEALVKEGNAHIAGEICNRILLIDKENKKATLYKLLTSYFVTSIDSLAKGITPFTDSTEYKRVLEICDDEIKSELNEASEQIRQNMLLSIEDALGRGYYVGVKKLAYNYLSCYPSNDTVLLCKLLVAFQVRSLEEAEKKLCEIYNSPEYSSIMEKCSDKLKKELHDTSERIKDKIAKLQKRQKIKKLIIAAVIIGIFMLIFALISIINNSPMSIYRYSSYKDGIEITGISNINKAVKDGHLEIPAKICGKPVYCVSNIDYKKFSSVTLPDTVTVIGESAFNGCTQLKEVNIPNSVKIIGKNAFLGCISLKEIIIPNSVGEIRENAFLGCSSLEEIFIPVSVRTIENHAFKDCSKITIYCQSEEKPNDWAFSWNTNFRPTVWGVEEKGVTENGLYWHKKHDDTITIKKYIGSQVSVVIPSIINGYQVTRIDDNAFTKKSEVISIEIPDTVATIGAQAFYDCKNLKAIKLPHNLKYVETNLFLDCSALETAELPWGIVEIKESAFEGCSSLTNVNIPNTVTSIGNSVFNGCTALASIEVPNSVTSIGSSAFSKCSSLSSFKIPSSIEIINNGTFSGCSSLNSIEIPNSVTAIRDRAFEGCSKLVSVTLPNIINAIGREAFYGCRGLTSIVIPKSVTYIGSYVFASCDDLTIYCEAEEQPSKWDPNWDYNFPVVWGYQKY